MLWRRYAHGVWPLLVWADDEEAADFTAALHASVLRPIVAPVVWITADEARAMYGLLELEDDE